jgi:hypothetical protein
MERPLYISDTWERGGPEKFSSSLHSAHVTPIRYLGQQSFPLTERQYLEHLEYIAQKLLQWGKAKEFKEYLANVNKKPNAYFGYAVSIPVNISEEELAAFVEEVRLSDD